MSEQVFQQVSTSETYTQDPEPGARNQKSRILNPNPETALNATPRILDLDWQVIEPVRNALRLDHLGLISSDERF